MSAKELLGKPASLWVATTPETSYAPLAANHQADVVIVGAGIVGLTAALLLQREGKSVVVLEAGHIAEGVTGYTTAKITSAHQLIYADLIKTFGEEKARLYAEANEAGLQQIRELVTSYGIECDLLDEPAFTYCTEKSALKNIKKEVKAADALGLPASFAIETGLPFPVAGAIRYECQASFHPRKYLLGLAKEFIAKGGVIYEQTRALDIEEGEEVCRVKTGHGIVTARDVLMATHFPFYDKGFYFARLEPERSYALAVELEKGERYPVGMYINAEEPTHSIRTLHSAEGDFLLVGGEGHKTGHGGDTRERYRILEAYVRQYFPVKRVAYRWSSQDNRTLDRVPYIGLHIPGSRHVYVATGFGKWGMSAGTAAAMLVRDLVMGRENAWRKLFDPNRFKPLASASQALKANVSTGFSLVKNHLLSEGNDISEVKPGEGKVLALQGKKVAVYRDEKGKVRAHSAICPHMGCVVNWNPAEKSWDCPCHGSRFATNGAVLHGPALSPLEEIDS